jgi:hypothetical protein
MLDHTISQRTKTATNEGEFVIALAEPVQATFNITSEQPDTTVSIGQL